MRHCFIFSANRKLMNSHTKRKNEIRRQFSVEAAVNRFTFTRQNISLYSPVCDQFYVPKAVPNLQKLKRNAHELNCFALPVSTFTLHPFNVDG